MLGIIYSTGGDCKVTTYVLYASNKKFLRQRAFPTKEKKFILHTQRENEFMMRPQASVSKALASFARSATRPNVRMMHQLVGNHICNGKGIVKDVRAEERRTISVRVVSVQRAASRWMSSLDSKDRSSSGSKLYRFEEVRLALQA